MMVCEYIKDGLLQQKNISHKEFIEELDDIIQDFKKDNTNELIHNLEDIKKEYAKQYAICYKCGVDLDLNFICTNCGIQN